MGIEHFSRMEEMKDSTPFLFNLPTEIIEEIFSYLTLSVRKKLRLTCKRLYELCNSDHFCRNENITFSEDLIDYASKESDLFHIGRSYYNLKIGDQKMEKSLIVPLFEKLGSRIRSLDIQNCIFELGLLESIIMLCEGLCSLRLNLQTIPLHRLIFEPLLITRPHVTDLKITLPLEKPYEYFHRMFSIFPNVKKLHIRIHHKIYDTQNVEKLTEEFPSILDDIMNSGGNLESLQLQIVKYQWISKKANFFEALPRLKDLTIEFCSYDEVLVPLELEKWYPCCSNLVSVRLDGLKVFRPPEMIRLLTNTRLKYLSIESESLVFDKESFKKLVASQLHTICFDRVRTISALPTTILDSPLEANKTVQYLYLRTFLKRYQSVDPLFLRYFHGLVHLTIHSVTDSILQCIFKYQENLRSLELRQCNRGSIEGFCGSGEAGLHHSINNLRKLEHLTITDILPEVINSEDFKRAFNFPRLKYLRMHCENRTFNLPYAEIPIILYENLTELRAAHFRDFAMPSSVSLQLLLRCREHLSYLRYDIINSTDELTKSATFINKKCRNFPTAKEYPDSYEYSTGQVYYDEKLDRTVILNKDLRRQFHYPKVGAFEIDWIEA